MIKVFKYSKCIQCGLYFQPSIYISVRCFGLCSKKCLQIELDKNNELLRLQDIEQNNQ